MTKILLCQVKGKIELKDSTFKDVIVSLVKADKCLEIGFPNKKGKWTDLILPKDSITELKLILQEF